MGRPSLNFTESKIQILKDWAGILSKSELAQCLGMCEKSFYNILERNKEIKDIYIKSLIERIKPVAERFYQQALTGEKDKGLKYLSKFGDKFWREDGVDNVRDQALSVILNQTVMFDDINKGVSTEEIESKLKYDLDNDLYTTV